MLIIPSIILLESYDASSSDSQDSSTSSPTMVPEVSSDQADKSSILGCWTGDLPLMVQPLCLTPIISRLTINIQGKE